MRTICHWIIRFTQTEANICITIGPIYVIAVTRFTARYRLQVRSVIDSYKEKKFRQAVPVIVILLLCTVVSFSSALVNNDGLNIRSRKTDDILTQTLQENVILCVYVSSLSTLLLASFPLRNDGILLVLLMLPRLLLDWHHQPLQSRKRGRRPRGRG